MKKINEFIITAISIFAIIYFLSNFSVLTLSEKLTSLSLIPVLFGVKIIRKVFKLKMDDGTELMYLLFVIGAQLVGSVFHAYDSIKYYDKFIHFLSGALSSIFALTLLNNTKLKNRTIMIDIIFIITFTLAIAGLWEFFEFFSDLILKGDAQRVVTSGVTDTMTDMIAAFISSIIFSCIYHYKASKLVNN